MDKAGFVFKVKRFATLLLSGIGRLEAEHWLFELRDPLSSFEVFCRLARGGWQPNLIGYTYRHQIYQARRLVDGRYQYHIRFYRDRNGLQWCSGHFEITPEWSTRRHLAGEELRTMGEGEAAGLKLLLRGD